MPIEHQSYWCPASKHQAITIYSALYGTKFLMGVTKDPFVNFSVSKIFDPAKAPAIFCITFLIDRRHRSSAAVTPVKYERGDTEKFHQK